MMIPTYPDLTGRVALVTGGSRGIGAATCRVLAAAGMKVAVNGRDRAAIATVVDAIQADGGDAVAVVADCTSFEEIEEMRREVEWELGPVDVLAPFAGGGGEPVSSAEISEERWRAVIDGNLTATFLTVRSFLPRMIERRRGSIITMASSAARLPSPASPAYAAAKAGIVTFSRHLANEVGRHSIRVNCISPSAIATERLRSSISEEGERQLAAIFPLGRIGEPEDVALATLFLASESSSWLTGITLDVAGGRVMI